MSRATRIRTLVESCLRESSPAAVARQQVKPEFDKDIVVLQASWGGGGGYMMGFLSVNKPISSWKKYVASLNDYLKAKKITYAKAELASPKNDGIYLVSKGESRILDDDKLMDVIDMWITDKTNWHVIDMNGRDAENKKVFVEDE